MIKKIIIKTIFVLFLFFNTFANANDIAELGGISEAAGNSAQAAADQLASDAGKVAKVSILFPNSLSKIFRYGS